MDEGAENQVEKIGAEEGNLAGKLRKLGANP